MYTKYTSLYTFVNICIQTHQFISLAIIAPNIEHLLIIMSDTKGIKCRAGLKPADMSFARRDVLHLAENTGDS